MKAQTKILALGTATILAAGIGWNALADPPASGAAPMPASGCNSMGSHMGSGIMGRVFIDPSGYLASVRQDLGITEAEGPAWDAYAKAVQEVASLKMPRAGTDMKAMHDAANGQAVMAQFRDQYRQARQTLRTAADQLVATLDEGQKKKAEATLAGMASGGPSMMEHMAMMGAMMEHMGMMGEMMENMGMMGNGAMR
ncbi:MAG: Spy/CpxP family protein refolding chaperone [Alphaproteobacteria bacterium]